MVCISRVVPVFILRWPIFFNSTVVINKAYLDYGGCDYGECDYGECDYGGFYRECDYGEC